MFSIEDCRLAGIASKRNVSIRRVAGCLEAYEFLIHSTSHVDGTARTRDVGCVLNGTPRCRLTPGIRIIPRDRHIEGGVGLAEGTADDRKEHQKGYNFHTHPPQKSIPLIWKRRSQWPHFHKQIPVELNLQMCTVS